MCRAHGVHYILTQSTATTSVKICVIPQKMFEEFLELGSNISKKVLKNGKFGRKPSLGWNCRIILSYENQENKENLEIVIGNGCSAKERLIETCVQSMHLKEHSSFILRLKKEDQDLGVNIVLTDVKEKPYIFQWTEGEKLEASNFYKAKGTELYKENLIEEAFYKFSTALKFTLLLDAVLETDEPDDTISNLRTNLYNNLAGCHLHFKNYLLVIKLCSASLKLNPSSKAYYRRALANIELKEYEKAEIDLIELLKIEPKNKAALEKYKLVRELDKCNRENYESIVKKMFH